MRALRLKKNAGVTEHQWERSFPLPENRPAEHIRKSAMIARRNRELDSEPLRAK
jgi:hypothetical protein